MAMSLLDVNPNKTLAEKGAQLSVATLVRQIATEWPSYHRKGRVDKTDPVYTLVTVDLPKALIPYVANYDNIIVEGSTGAGNITAAPWIALFDRRLTTSATLGYYVVYLFSTDMSTVTLSLAFGTTQFEKQFGGPSKAFPRMRSAAGRLQEMFNHLIPSKLLKGPISLAAKPTQKLHYSYEQASILSYPPYAIAALPDESKLVADLTELLKLYTEIVSDPLEATVDRLVEAVVEPANSTGTIEVCDFQPRERHTSEGMESAGVRGRRERRYSPESRKVGDAGERVVLRYEKERLTNLGRPDLADRVRWHGQRLEFCGWDITSFDENGNEFFIEVKASIGKSISCINLTVNEWTAACDTRRKDRYFVYLVTNVLSVTPRIERLQNPAAYVQSGQLSCEAIVYELQFGRSANGL
jgi:hypothetical protein